MKRHDARINRGRLGGAQADAVASDSALDSTVVQSPADGGLDAEELAYFTLQHEGFTRARIAAELGWSSVKIERVRRRLNLHLARLRGPAPKVITRGIPPGEYAPTRKGVWIPAAGFPTCSVCRARAAPPSKWIARPVSEP